jgi:hypothetical protein
MDQFSNGPTCQDHLKLDTFVRNVHEKVWFLNNWQSGIHNPDVHDMNPETKSHAVLH